MTLSSVMSLPLPLPSSLESWKYILKKKSSQQEDGLLHVCCVAAADALEPWVKAGSLRGLGSRSSSVRSLAPGVP